MHKDYTGTIWVDSEGNRYVESKRNGGDRQHGTFEVRLTSEEPGALPEWWTTDDLSRDGMIAIDEKAPTPAATHPDPSAMAREAYPGDTTAQSRARVAYGAGVIAERARVAAWLRDRYGDIGEALADELTGKVAP